MAEPHIGTRAFVLEKDLDAVKRIWQEVGWVEEEHEIAQLDHFFACGRTLLGTMDESPECSVHVTRGTMRLDASDLPLCAVTAVTTSRIARGHSFAQRLTAQQLQYGADTGAAVAALGMFDQGFYDKLGFGTGAYDHEFTIDPGTLMIDRKPGTPVRLSTDEYEEIHTALMNRNKVNGSVCLEPAILMRAEVGFDEKGFGLGYRDGGVLTHFVWLVPKGERGPYRVNYMAYRNTDELIELLALLKSLADQVYSLTIIEPPEIQLQALLQRPFRNMALTEKSKHAAEHESYSWWQFRVLDVAACVKVLRCRQGVEFVLRLSDPAENFLTDEGSWQGASGDYIVELGDRCTAVPGSSSQLPVLECSVNAFTRLIWNVAPASSLAVTDDFAARPGLLSDLDQAFALPPPRPGWDF